MAPKGGKGANSAFDTAADSAKALADASADAAKAAAQNSGMNAKSLRESFQTLNVDDFTAATKNADDVTAATKNVDDITAATKNADDLTAATKNADELKAVKGDDIDMPKQKKAEFEGKYGKMKKVVKIAGGVAVATAVGVHFFVKEEELQGSRDLCKGCCNELFEGEYDGAPPEIWKGMFTTNEDGYVNKDDYKPNSSQFQTMNYTSDDRIDIMEATNYCYAYKQEHDDTDAENTSSWKYEGDGEYEGCANTGLQACKCKCNAIFVPISELPGEILDAAEKAAEELGGVMDYFWYIVIGVCLLIFAIVMIMLLK